MNKGQRHKRVHHTTAIVPTLAANTDFPFLTKNEAEEEENELH